MVQGLITDRTQYNVSRRNMLSAKGWANMTNDEQKEWLGDPFATTGVNLFSCGPYYSSAVELKFRNQEIVATATSAGTYLYAISIIGDAVNYENKVFTLSVDSITASGTGTPQMAVYWHDENGYEYAGASLLSAGSVTFNTTEWPNTNARKSLAVYVYVTTFEAVESMEYARFGRVMLESGADRHDYIPYTEIVPTPTTKGAYNYSDLNRVERAVAEIAEGMGLTLETKTNWSMWDIPNSSDMERYINNIEAIRSVLSNTSGVPNAPTTMNNFTYEQANNIELILSAAYESLSE